jgi:hypothetical protein
MGTRITARIALGLALAPVLACGAGPADDGSANASAGSALATNGVPQVRLECELQYEFEDCPDSCGVFTVDTFTLPIDRYPTVDHELGTSHHPFLGRISVEPHDTPKGNSTTDGYFRLALEDTASGRQQSSSGNVSLSELATSDEVFAGEIDVENFRFQYAGRTYDHAMLSCVFTTRPPKN